MKRKPRKGQKIIIYEKIEGFKRASMGLVWVK